MTIVIEIIGSHIEFEYFCTHCLQLRLCFEERNTCGNCGASGIIKADVGALDKDELLAKYSNKE